MIKILLLSAVFSALLPAKEQGVVLIRVQGISVAEGKVRLALFQERSEFPQTESAMMGRVLPAQRQGLQCSIEGLAYGTYAVAAFHDLNGNGQLDRNPFGLPTEPYAFSNNPSVKWRAPRFRDAAFRLSRPVFVLDIKLRSWSEH